MRPSPAAVAGIPGWGSGDRQRTIACDTPKPEYDLLKRKYGRGAPELFARLAELSPKGGHGGVTTYLYELYLKRPDLQEAYPAIDGDGAHQLVDWAYRYGRDEVPFPPELLPSKWLNAPATVGNQAGVTRYMEHLYSRSPALRKRFPDLGGADADRFVAWARTEGTRQDPVLAQLVAGMVDTDARAAWPRELPRRLAPGLSAQGVNVIGLLHSGMGLGESARLVVSALDAARIPVAAVARSAPTAKETHPYPTIELAAAPHGVDLVCLNPDQHWQLARQLDRAWAARRYTIGFWWWEVKGSLPVEWRPGYHLVDEVWVGSDHTAEAVGAFSPVPVVKVKLPVAPAPALSRSRVSLGLPADTFLFLFFFDYMSTPARKNPFGVIDAFRRAFAPASGASLVIKSINGAHHPAKREGLEALARGHPDVHLVDRLLAADEKNAMLASCDCYVSLHRAEGFGLPLAEAMYYGKPVIATRYSGNLEFMTDENSYLVRSGTATVPREAEPYPAGAEWAEPDVEHAARLMREVFENRQQAAQRGRLAAEHMRRRFSPAAAAHTMGARLDHIRADLVVPTSSLNARTNTALPRTV